MTTLDPSSEASGTTSRRMAHTDQPGPRQRVLLTGGSSRLGGAVALALAARGDQVTTLQRRSANLGLTEVLADITDPNAVLSAVTGQDAVIHLAAKAGVAGAWDDYYEPNVTGTKVVLDACRQAGVSRLIYVSSPSVAHTGSSLIGVGAEPADPAHARSPYAKTKAIAEQLVLAADSPGLRVLAIRPHIIWGPGDTQFVGQVVARAKAGPLPVFGSGAALIDTTYVDNAADALVAALDRVELVHGRALVVSNGEPRPVAEFFTALAVAGGVTVRHQRLPVRLGKTVGSTAEAVWSLAAKIGRPMPNDPPMTRFLAEQLSTAHWFDQRETRALLNWRPRVSLDSGFDRLAAWYAARR